VLVRDVHLDDKSIVLLLRNRVIKIAWYSLSPKVDLWIDGASLSFRADSSIYDKVIRPLILGDRKIIDVVMRIARFRSERTHEKYVRILAEFGVDEAVRWLNASPVRHFIKIAEVKAFEDGGRWIAGVRKPWGSVFMARLSLYGRRAFVVTLNPEPRMYLIVGDWRVKEVDAIIAVKLAEDSIRLKECDVMGVPDSHLAGLMAFQSKDVLSYLYVDAFLVHKMLMSA